MIHTASLMHDDVMDHATHRRGVPSLNSVHGNQLAILAGDFLLSRASLNLARLQNVEVGDAPRKKRSMPQTMCMQQAQTWEDHL